MKNEYFERENNEVKFRFKFKQNNPLSHIFQLRQMLNCRSKLFSPMYGAQLQHTESYYEFQMTDQRS